MPAPALAAVEAAGPARQAAAGTMVGLYGGLVPGDLLDVILIVLAAAFAVAGYRQGFIVGLLSFAGFLGGAAVGAFISPAIARSLVSGAAQQALVAIIVVFLTAMLGQLLASVIGAAARSRMVWRPAAFLDSVGGAAVSVLSVLLIAWLIGSAVAGAPFPVVVRQVNDSAVLRGVGQMLPPAAATMFSDFRRLLATGPYTQVFSGLGEQGVLAVSPAPDAAVLQSAGLARAKRSIVKIEGIAPSCHRNIEGSGFVYAPDHVLTNAHVMAGVTTGLTVRNEPGQQYSGARVVFYDPDTDIAVLYVPGLGLPSLTFAGPAARGQDAIVAGYPGGGSFTAVPARIGGTEPATGPNIYRDQTITRSIYSVRAVVQPGNSGGPLLSPGGHVYGVVFAAAVDAVQQTGYALTAAQVAHDATTGAHATAPVSTEGCAAG